MFIICQKIHLSSSLEKEKKGSTKHILHSSIVWFSVMASLLVSQGNRHPKYFPLKEMYCPLLKRQCFYPVWTWEPCTRFPVEKIWCWNWCQFFSEFTVLTAHKKQMSNDQDKKIAEIVNQGHFLRGCKIISHLEQECIEHKICLNLTCRNSTKFGVHLENHLHDTSFLSWHHHLLISRKKQQQQQKQANKQTNNWDSAKNEGKYPWLN